HDLSTRGDPPDDVVVAVGEEDVAIRIHRRRIGTVKPSAASPPVTKTHLTRQTGERRDIALRRDLSNHVVAVVRDVDVSLSIDTQPGRFVETRFRPSAVSVTDAARSAGEVREGGSIGGGGIE